MRVELAKLRRDWGRQTAFTYARRARPREDAGDYCDDR